jgi:hypothetical protein
VRIHIGTFEIESLQIYFAGSLELQEELMKTGFKVPKPTPLPIIYANFRGWVSDKPPITIERLIHPSRYVKSYRDLGWDKTTKDGKEAYIIPDERCLLNVEIEEEKEEILLLIKPVVYHLERTSIRQVGPEKWSNWMMFYLNIRDMLVLAEKLLEKVKLSDNICRKTVVITREVQQGGKEETYFCGFERGSGIPVKDFSVCMGCFDHVISYLKNEASDDRVVDTLKLRLNYSSEVGGFAKIGLAKIEGKKPQFMFKLASYPIERSIKGILKEVIRGKARGNLAYCTHESKLHNVSLDFNLFSRTLCCIRRILRGDMPKNWICWACYEKFREPEWFGEIRQLL